MPGFLFGYKEEWSFTRSFFMSCPRLASAPASCCLLAVADDSEQTCVQDFLLDSRFVDEIGNKNIYLQSFCCGQVLFVCFVV